MRVPWTVKHGDSVGVFSPEPDQREPYSARHAQLTQPGIGAPLCLFERDRVEAEEEWVFLNAPRGETLIGEERILI